MTMGPVDHPIGTTNMKNLAAALVLATVLAVPSLACAKDLTIAAPIATYRLLVAGANGRPALAEANGLDALFMVPRWRQSA